MSHISLVTLGVADLARATAFYEALGWRRSAASADGVVTFFHGAPVLALFGHEALAADAGVPPPPPTLAESTALAMNLPSARDVDEAVVRAERAGAAVTRPPRRTEWGGYSGCFRDPDGHLWEVAHNPGFPLDADGRVRLPDAT